VRILPRRTAEVFRLEESARRPSLYARRRGAVQASELMNLRCTTRSRADRTSPDRMLRGRFSPPARTRLVQHSTGGRSYDQRNPREVEGQCRRTDNCSFNQRLFSGSSLNPPTSAK
jgi:hypothetical protein